MTEAYSTTTQNSHLEPGAKYKYEEYKAFYRHYIDSVSVRIEINIDFRLTDTWNGECGIPLCVKTDVTNEKL
jgi:hypothetical protein